MTTNEFTPAEEAMLEQEFQALLGEYIRSPHGNRVELITRAYQLAKSAHHGVRRLSGEPYMMHPLSVARIVVNEIGLGSTSICAALLHDVVEDTDYTIADLTEMGFDKAVTDAIALMTHAKGVEYMAYVRAIKENPIAKTVKLADLKHNADLTRLDSIDEKALLRREKYLEAIRLLSE
jgi:GTP pyrophosphokinase